jgi:NaMN:DMB phosphoribosyltransferase
MGTDAPPARRTLAGTLVLAGLVVLALAAAVAPALVAGGFVLAAVAAAVRRSLREGRFPLARDPRRVCVPRTGVCVEV